MAAVSPSEARKFAKDLPPVARSKEKDGGLSAKVYSAAKRTLMGSESTSPKLHKSSSVKSDHKFSDLLPEIIDKIARALSQDSLNFFASSSKAVKGHTEALCHEIGLYPGIILKWLKGADNLLALPKITGKCAEGEDPLDVFVRIVEQEWIKEQKEAGGKRKIFTREAPFIRGEVSYEGERVVFIAIPIKELYVIEPAVPIVSLSADDDELPTSKNALLVLSCTEEEVMLNTTFQCFEEFFVGEVSPHDDIPPVIQRLEPLLKAVDELFAGGKSMSETFYSANQLGDNRTYTASPGWE